MHRFQPSDSEANIFTCPSRTGLIHFFRGRTEGQSATGQRDTNDNSRTSSQTDKGQVLLHLAWQIAGAALQRFLVGTLQASCEPSGAIMRNLYFRERWAQGLMGLSEKLYNSHNLLLQLVSH